VSGQLILNAPRQAGRQLLVAGVGAQADAKRATRKVVPKRAVSRQFLVGIASVMTRPASVRCGKSRPGSSTLFVEALVAPKAGRQPRRVVRIRNIAGRTWHAGPAPQALSPLHERSSCVSQTQ
jgi:hypothetical protein